MTKDIVIGIDSSTTATKATAWDRDGNLIAEGRRSIPLENPGPGLFEQDPRDWWESTRGALQDLTSEIDPGRVASLAISNQRETFAIFDEAGEAVHQGMVWLDERAFKEADWLADKVGADRVHEISGKPVDVIVPINSMIWLREERPDAFAKMAHYADVNCYLTSKLTGQWVTPTASGDPSGMLDTKAGIWSEELLTAAGIPMEVMPALTTSGSLVGPVTEEAAALTGLVAGTPLIAGGGDGQCAAAGAGTVEPQTAYMNLGTALVAGVYSPSYGHDLAFRTETAVSDSGFIFEIVLKTGTFLIDWFVREIAGVADEDKVAFLQEIEKQAVESPIGSGGIVLLPFWQGSMTPHWDARARGVMVGMSGSTKQADLYRAVLEGLALDQAYALEKATASMGGNIDRIVAIGGGAASQLFLQILADSINVPVCKAEVAEASALGAAMCAAKGAGWYGTLREASLAMSQKDLTVTEPIPENAARYAEFREVYDGLWPALSEWNKKLWSFADGR